MVVVTTTGLDWVLDNHQDDYLEDYMIIRIITSVQHGHLGDRQNDHFRVLCDHMSINII